jgi:hypothetical protein
MPRKPGLTLEQHEKLGLELQIMSDRLVTISVELCKAYPRKIADVASKAGDTILGLRGALDDKVCQENPGLKEAEKIYYRSHREGYKRAR